MLEVMLQLLEHVEIAITLSASISPFEPSGYIVGKLFYKSDLQNVQ